VSFRLLTLIGLLLTSLAAQAQQPAPTGMSLAEAASRRFPQPVTVGDLIHRQVLQPEESQPTLGWVRDVVKRPDGTIEAVIDFSASSVLADYPGRFGWFIRPIAVPVDAMVLLGQYMEIVDFSPDQLRQFKTYDGSETTPLPRDSMVTVGLARPSH
jgi:hypothetical protein